MFDIQIQRSSFDSGLGSSSASVGLLLHVSLKAREKLQCSWAANVQGITLVEGFGFAECRRLLQDQLHGLCRRPLC